MSLPRASRPTATDYPGPKQNADASFTEHVILGKTKEDNADGKGLRQIHAVQLEDINGDGLLDIVCGKRRWAHGINPSVSKLHSEPVFSKFSTSKNLKSFKIRF